MKFNKTIIILNDYQRFCYKVIDCIKFIKKHGHYAKGIYLKYYDNYIDLTSEEEHIINNLISIETIHISEEILHPIKEGVSFEKWIKLMVDIKNNIEDKIILIDYKDLSYEERINIQSIFNELSEKDNTNEDMSKIYGYKA